MKINDESEDSEDIIDLEDEEFNPDEDASGSDNRPKRGRKKSRKRSSSGASSKRRSSITDEDEDLEDEIPAIAIKGSSKPYKPSLKKPLKKPNIGEFLKLSTLYVRLFIANYLSNDLREKIEKVRHS